jgi:hypothetical protein
MHPELDDSMAYDLAGLAIVASMNEQTSWSLTNRFGREWSCFNGAIRIYWPSSLGLVNPLKPSDGTAPDKCVRIYFDWDEGRSKFVIGWIGRHPD